jgi:23S rRNA pseudouridine2605 synthase
MNEAEGVRLQKVLAAAGLASRRASEIMISEGRVEVNGRVVTEQGLRVDPDRDVVRVDGSRIPPPRRHLYLVLNKPRGVVSTLGRPGRPADHRRPAGQPAARQAVPAVSTSVAGHRDRGPVDLDQRRRLRTPARPPEYEVPKTYLAEVEGVVNPHTLKRSAGRHLEDGPVPTTSVKVVSSAAEKTLVRITLTEGPDRIVRRTM